MNSIQDYRDFYANHLVKREGCSRQDLIDAFASVERERFMGKGPWQIYVGSGYMPTISDDPRLLYQDILVGLATDRGINNGQPSLHASCLAACAPALGESVVHIGAGTGYYTAILAALVGFSGSVVAYEVESDLAEVARENLSASANVKVVSGSATSSSIPQADVIYVCAGLTDPPDPWLDALSVGGRLVFPLTSDEGHGCMLLLTRCSHTDYAARSILEVDFIPCVGARNQSSSKAINIAIRTRSLYAIRSLQRHKPPDNSAWCVGPGWWLSTKEVAHVQSITALH